MLCARRVFGTTGHKLFWDGKIAVYTRGGSWTSGVKGKGGGTKHASIGFETTSERAKIDCWVYDKYQLPEEFDRGGWEAAVWLEATPQSWTIGLHDALPRRQTHDVGYLGLRGRMETQRHALEGTNSVCHMLRHMMLWCDMLRCIVWCCVALCCGM